MSQLYSLILASQSPRRKAFLSQLGYQFESISPDIDESLKPQETPHDYVARLALEKAQSIAKKSADATVVIGSDTCVVYQQRILGKPENLQQCREYLLLLSGTTHQVYTGVAVVQQALSKTSVVCTHVEFDEISDAEINAYWQSGEPKDKAGGYGIQGIGGQFVKTINGSYSSVVGLPLCETKQLLTQFNIFTPFNSTTTK
ncbi:Maf family protein [Thalassotalea sp. 1_MG-2023]|uniref:Maf family protein n=1 Tax=Thalassotalea sp. 1_MG-2023 TaxID=3062680 RepID=UPI0026E1519F|nr:Maf family protein [Thalassotalea sp. 1_MG-2023]MDO6426309.1 Maf family protein [Thalassotalea sp. 1_MG-2023]